MKALVLREIGGPDNLSIETIETPTPGKGQVRVKLEAAALNRRDVWITLGQYPKITFPCVAGSDGAGIVDAVGENVSDALIGNEVVIYPALDWGEDPLCGGKEFRVLGMPDQGTFAEYICVPAESISAKPKHLSWAEAAAIPLAGLTAWRAVVTHGEVKAGQKVLVTGIGGGAAGFALRWALAKGAEVVCTSSSQDKIEAACRLGARDGYDYTDVNWVKQLKAEVGSVDLVIDSAGGDGMPKVLDSLKNGGRYVFFGATRGNCSSGLNMAKLFFKQIRIQGTTMGMPGEFKEMMDFVSENKIRPVIDSVYAFADGITAHQRMLDSEQMGKLVITFD
ncbi:MAG: quinone oxidoreductase family protein [Gammaproteobacteria bacterium]|jgi:zinc-binding alcohol dehydrogenase/oxidoreductase|tara:strand:- start:1155 stop:2162 length:1008 start_codon:yes stop_codon:yes gene_type:complete